MPLRRGARPYRSPARSALTAIFWSSGFSNQSVKSLHPIRRMQRIHRPTIKAYVGGETVDVHEFLAAIMAMLAQAHQRAGVEQIYVAMVRAHVIRRSSPARPRRAPGRTYTADEWRAAACAAAASARSRRGAARRPASAPILTGPPRRQINDLGFGQLAGEQQVFQAVA
jgi:hypothetical protein